MKLIYFFTGLLLLSSPLGGEIVRRAAFDFGSGSIRLQVADVETETNRLVGTVYNHVLKTFLSSDLARQIDGSFSDEIQEIAIYSARELKQHALAHNATEFSGIATAAYRQAHNGQELIDRIKREVGIDVRIISQEEEGFFGFQTLVSEFEISADQLVAWDTGAGSLQITYLDALGVPCHYMADFGRCTTADAIIESVKKQDLKKTVSPNPITRQDWTESLHYLHQTLPKMPDSLIAKVKLANVRLVAMGAQPASLKAMGTYTMEDLDTLSDSLLNLTDEQLEHYDSNPTFTVTDAILAKVILQKLNMQKVETRHTAGSTSGVLTSPSEWKRMAGKK